MKRTRKQKKKSNPIAKDLMTTKYKPRVVQDKRRKERDDPRFNRRLDIEGR